MTTVNIHQAKTHFSKLIDAVGHGQEFIIAKAGKPAAKLIPIATSRPQRKPGALKGKIHLTSAFDDPLPPEILDLFEKK